MPNIIPCPLCGSGVIIEYQKLYDDTEVRVSCNTCKIGFRDLNTSGEELIDRWRTILRPTDHRPLGPAQLAVKMRLARDDRDFERAHALMDDILTEELRRLGYREAIDIFDQQDMWYA